MDTGFSPDWAKLRDITDRVRAMGDEITVIFVANRQDAVVDDPLDRSTEYFTDQEATQILTALRAAGFRTLYFEGENEFISFVLSGELRLQGTPKILVYNTAQSGTDPGRKSMIPAFCALHGIPTCNSNSYAVSLARHKVHVHAILRRHGIPTPDSWSFDARSGWMLNQPPPFDEKLIAKAGYESASIGLDEDSVGYMSPEFEAALTNKSVALGQHFIVQKFVSGYEFEVPVINVGSQREVVGPVAITLNGSRTLGEQVLSFSSVAKDGFGFAPCVSTDFPQWSEMREAAANVCIVLGLAGFARVDFRMDTGGAFWVTDVSTSPHIVGHSAYWHAFQQVGWEYFEMLACMVAVNASNYSWI